MWSQSAAAARHGGWRRVFAGEPPQRHRERGVRRVGLRCGRVRALAGRDEPGDGSDRPVHRVREHPGDRGYSQDPAAADAHQRVHRVACERGPHHGASGCAIWRGAGGARLLDVRLVLLRVLDLRGRALRHRQHRDSVRNRHRQVCGHHLTFPLPELVNQIPRQGGGVRGVGHLRAGLLPPHPHALVPRQRGHRLLR